MKILWIEDMVHEHCDTLFEASGLFADQRHEYLYFSTFDEYEKEVLHANECYDLVVIDIDLSGFTDCGVSGEKYMQEFHLSTDDFLQEAGFHLYLRLLQQGFSNNRIVFLTANSNGKTIEHQLAFQQRILNHALNTHDQTTFHQLIGKIKQVIRDSKEDITYFEQAYKNDCGDGREINACLALLAKQEQKNIGEDNRYEKFHRRFMNARLPLSPSINKNQENNFRLWLEERLTPRTPYVDGHGFENYDFAYMTLRRGIISACEYLIKQIDNTPQENLKTFLLFYTTTSEEVAESQKQYVIDYLTKLQNFFPLNSQDNKKQRYLLFLKELSGDWEKSFGDFAKEKKDTLPFSFPSVEYKFKQNNQAIMKLLRNWTAHNVFTSDVQEKDVAYLFMIAMRSWLNLSVKEILPHEKILAILFDFRGGPLENSQIQCQLTDSYSTLIRRYEETSIRKSSLPYGQFRDLVQLFGNLGKEKYDVKPIIQQQSVKLCYQHFWHGIFWTKSSRIKSRVTEKGFCVQMFIDFYNESLSNYEFLEFLGKAIWNESF